MRVDLPPGLPEVLADPPIMERVIANVAGNARRYSPAGSPPLLTARARGGRVEVRVADHGPGVLAAGRDKMFLPFQRLGDTDPATGVGLGLGLGLAVSRGLIEAMRGTLEPGQTPGGGLSMTMSLPAAPRPARTPLRPARQPRAQRKRIDRRAAPDHGSA